MTTHGSPEEELEWHHYNLGGGRGSLQVRHIPSGISVQADCGDTPVFKTIEQLLEELQRRVANARG